MTALTGRTWWLPNRDTCYSYGSHEYLTIGGLSIRYVEGGILGIRALIEA
jgi:hypothetical protein